MLFHCQLQKGSAPPAAFVFWGFLLLGTSAVTRSGSELNCCAGWMPIAALLSCVCRWHRLPHVPMAGWTVCDHAPGCRAVSLPAALPLPMVAALEWGWDHTAARQGAELPVSVCPSAPTSPGAVSPLLLLFHLPLPSASSFVRSSLFSSAPGSTSGSRRPLAGVGSFHPLQLCLPWQRLVAFQALCPPITLLLGQHPTGTKGDPAQPHAGTGGKGGSCCTLLVDFLNPKSEVAKAKRWRIEHEFLL